MLGMLMPDCVNGHAVPEPAGLDAPGYDVLVSIARGLLRFERIDRGRKPVLEGHKSVNVGQHGTGPSFKRSELTVVSDGGAELMRKRS